MAPGERFLTQNSAIKTGSSILASIRWPNIKDCCHSGADYRWAYIRQHRNALWLNVWVGLSISPRPAEWNAVGRDGIVPADLILTNEHPATLPKPTWVLERWRTLNGVPCPM